MPKPNDSLLHIRMDELRRAREFMPLTPGDRLLEIGAGTGHQARELQSAGYDVEAIDIDASPYRDARVFPISQFDGTSLPFASNSFDVVFSSNVMEHVVGLGPLLLESLRVLKPGGISLHLMPTPAWRFWSFVTHVLWVPKRAMTILVHGRTDKARELGRMDNSRKSDFRAFAGALIPRRHGEHGTAVGELWSYRRRRWIAEFERAGFTLAADAPAGLFYTNSQLFASTIPLETRRSLARILGSSCRIYCFRKPA